MREARYTEAEWRTIDDMRRYWNAMCDCDVVPIDTDDLTEVKRFAGGFNATIGDGGSLVALMANMEARNGRLALFGEEGGDRRVAGFGRELAHLRCRWAIGEVSARGGRVRKAPRRGGWRAGSLRG